MTKSFTGVAYWSVDSLKTDWASQAREVLLPLQDAGLGSVECVRLPAGDQLVISLESHKQSMLISAGKGRGVVKPSVAASRFVVCLVALRKSLGDIDVVDDAQTVVPTLPRQSHPLFRNDYSIVVPVAEALGVAVNQQAAAAMRSMLF